MEKTGTPEGEGIRVTMGKDIWRKWVKLRGHGKGSGSHNQGE